MHLRVAHTIPPNVGLPMSKGQTDYNHRYVVVENKSQGDSLSSYLRTNFTNYVLARTRTIRNLSRNQCRYIPRVPLDRIWDDEQLIKYFELNDEIADTIRRFYEQ